MFKIDAVINSVRSQTKEAYEKILKKKERIYQQNNP